jgi:hypothetical protein
MTSCPPDHALLAGRRQHQRERGGWRLIRLDEGATAHISPDDPSAASVAVPLAAILEHPDGNCQGKIYTNGPTLTLGSRGDSGEHALGVCGPGEGFGGHCQSKIYTRVLLARAN